jgi:hypothetical protein
MQAAFGEFFSWSISLTGRILQKKAPSSYRVGFFFFVSSGRGSEGIEG